MNSRYLYISIFAFISITASLAVMAINVAIDPWSYFNTPSVAGFNLVKPDLHRYEREIEAHVLAKLRPKGLIMGASNSDVGLDPEHPGWGVGPVHNVATGLGSITMARRLLQHSLAFGNPEKIVLGLEYGMFDEKYQNDGGINPASLAVTVDGERNRDYLQFNFYANGFSLKMLNSSLKTFWLNFKQKDAADTYRPAITSTGMLNPDNFGNPSWKTYRDHFQSNIRYSVSSFWTPAEELIAIENPENEASFDRFREILALACEKNIELYIVLGPSHAYILVGQDALGLTGFWERWKKAVINTTSDYAQQTGCRETPVWDFSGYNELTTEVIRNERLIENSSNWYWDPLHYRKELGDDMLNRVFGRKTNNTALQDFGVRLTTENIDAHIEQNRALAVNYRETHPEEVNLVNNTVAATLESLEN